MGSKSKLLNVCEFIVDCEHKTANTVDSSDFISIRTPNIGKGYFILDGVNNVSEETFTTWTRRATPKKDDLIMAREAPAGNVALIRKEKNICLGQRTVLIRPNKEKVNPDYLCYLLLSSSVQAQVEGKSTGATVAHLNVSDIKNLELPDIPILSVQKQIASILSSYDELIEVNNQRIKLLEETAREIYKEWFVRMRFPGYKQADFVKGIPEGWEIKKVNQTFEILGGGTPSTEKDEYWDGDIDWYTPTDITGSNGIFLSESSNKITAKGLKESSAKLFPAYSIMMTSRATIGAVGINTKPGCTNQGFITCIPNEDIPYTFLYFWILFNKEMFEMLGTGSTFLEITKGTFKKISVLLPKSELIQNFHILVSPIFQQIENLQQQNVELRQVRDRLLPRLISGKLQIKAERTPAKVVSILPTESNALVAEEQAVYKAKKPNPFFQRRVLAAYIIDHLKDEPTFGHVKLMKLMYLCEYLAEIETASHYHRAAAGPYDNRMIRSIDSQLKEAQWFECIKTENKYIYKPLAKKEEYKTWFEKYYGEKETGIASLLSIFGKAKTEKAEMVATLYEAWRDLKSKEQAATDDAIMYEVLQNWHESKERIEEPRWRTCLQWMKEKQWIH